MRTLTAADITRIVEWGEDKHPLDRAIMLLGVAMPEVDRDALLHLPVGLRDRLLLDVRRSLFGSELELVAQCGPCSRALTFTITVEQLLESPPPDAREHLLTVEAYEVRFRLPTSLDLAAVVGMSSPEGARGALLHRCVQGVSLVGAEIVDALPVFVTDALVAQIEELDPLANITFALVCDRCHAPLQAALDVVTHLWTELRAEAERTQREVHLLARAYGWTEDTILTMSAARRRRYCQMVSDG